MQSWTYSHRPPNLFCWKLSQDLNFVLVNTGNIPTFQEQRSYPLKEGDWPRRFVSPLFTVTTKQYYASD